MWVGVLQEIVKCMDAMPRPPTGRRTSSGHAWFDWKIFVSVHKSIRGTLTAVGRLYCRI